MKVTTWLVEKPNGKYSICEKDCSHPECNELKKAIENFCVICDSEIGYNRRFCKSVIDNTLVHISCYKKLLTNILKEIAHFED